MPQKTKRKKGERNNFFRKKKKNRQQSIYVHRFKAKRDTTMTRFIPQFRTARYIHIYIYIYIYHHPPPPISIFSLAAGVQVAREFLITTLVRNLLDNVTGIRRQPISRKRFSSRHLPTR